MSISSSIANASPLFGLSRAQPLKDLFGAQKDDEANAAANPSADLLRMIQGVLQPEAAKKPADNRTDNIYARIQVNGKTVATIYNTGASETSNALARKAKQSEDGQGPELAQKRAEELAAASGGTIVKANTALTQAQWQAQQADKAGAIVDPVQQEKQRSYSGLQERRMIADPSMLVQAQLFAQQSFGFDAKTALSYVPPLDDQMKTDASFA